MTTRKILAGEEVEPHGTRLVGDSIVRGQLTEFCGRVSTKRKRFCMPGAGLDDITAAMNEATQGAINNDTGRSSSSSRPRLQSEYPYPEVIVSPERPAFPDPWQPPYAHPDRSNLGEGEDFHKVPAPPSVMVGNVKVQVEEICLVLVVLMLWAGAITLFINRWGKLRMLEPYQPAYTAPVAPPRPQPPPLGPHINIQSTSDLTLTEAHGSRWDWGAPESFGRGSLSGGYLGLERSPSCLSIRTLNPQRKVKSAVDLVSLVMQEKMSPNIHQAATDV